MSAQDDPDDRGTDGADEVEIVEYEVLEAELVADVVRDVDDGIDVVDVVDASGGTLGLGGFDLGSMMQMAQDVQTQVADAQQQLASTEVVGTAGGGAVSVTLNGHLHLVGISIDPEASDPEDPSMLEDLIRAAWQDAHDQVAQLQAAADPLGGLGGMLDGGLGGLLGGT